MLMNIKRHYLARKGAIVLHLPMQPWIPEHQTCRTALRRTWAPAGWLPKPVPSSNLQPFLWYTFHFRWRVFQNNTVCMQSKTPKKPSIPTHPMTSYAITGPTCFPYSMVHGSTNLATHTTSDTSNEYSKGCCS